MRRTDGIAKSIAQFLQIVGVDILFVEEVLRSGGSVGNEEKAVVGFLKKDFPGDREVRS